MHIAYSPAILPQILSLTFSEQDLYLLECVKEVKSCSLTKSQALIHTILPQILSLTFSEQDAYLLECVKRHIAIVEKSWTVYFQNSQLHPKQEHVGLVMAKISDASSSSSSRQQDGVSPTSSSSSGYQNAQQASSSSAGVVGQHAAAAPKKRPAGSAQHAAAAAPKRAKPTPSAKKSALNNRPGAKKIALNKRGRPRRATEDDADPWSEVDEEEGAAHQGGPAASSSKAVPHKDHHPSPSSSGSGSSPNESASSAGPSKPRKTSDAKQAKKLPRKTYNLPEVPDCDLRPKSGLWDKVKLPPGWNSGLYQYENCEVFV